MSIEDIEQVTREVLPDKANFRVLTGRNSVRVNIGPSKGIRRVDGKLKSLAIELATSITTKDPGIDVVITSFQNGNEHKCVTVNRTDLTALTTGKVNRKEFLQSMQVIDIRVTRCR